ncbi:hypothetical protein [Georgenia sp. AZ-5]|uniref:oxidoreductase n=1 Tax=Georgenia sp. AZ-5 TaxID=3367526 RepID=UPI003754E2B9
MSGAEISELIADFGRATRRALAAGFDGVEIHGANHYLLQQFLSVYSNHRTDAWGGDLDGRMAFILAVTEEVLRVRAEAGADQFVVGIRLCADEIHGETVGYTAEESSVLVDRLTGTGVDYVHFSLFTGYNARPAGSGKSYGQIAREAVAGRCPVVIVSDVFTAEDAESALAHGDLVAVGRAALVEPQFARKATEGRTDEIETSVEGRLVDLDLPAGLVEWYRGSGRSVLPPVPGLAQYLDASPALV